MTNLENKLPQSPNNSNFSIKTLTLAILIALGGKQINGLNTTIPTTNENTTTVQEPKNLKIDNGTIYLDSTAIDYIKKNFSINGNNISNIKDSILGDDKYSIKFDYPVPGDSSLNVPIEITIKLNYKDNSIIGNIINTKIGGTEINGNFSINNKYMFNCCINGTNITIDLNEYRTKELINRNINKHNYKVGNNIPTIKGLENTQLTSLNKIKIGKEIKECDNGYYLDLFFCENGNYIPTGKLFFDKEGNIDTTMTKNNFGKEKTQILGIDVELEITNNNTIKISDTTINKLIKKIESDRKIIIETINNSKIGPNTIFTGLNKVRQKNTEENKETWGFNSKLLTIDLGNNEYILQWGKNKGDILRFKIEGGNLKLINGNHETTNKIILETTDGIFSIELGNGGLDIKLVKNGEENNKSEIYPEYKGEKDITERIKNANIIFDLTKNILSYYDNEGSLITYIKVSKEDGKFKISRQSTDIDIFDLYKKYTNENIKNLSNKIGITEISLINSFEKLLEKNGINLKDQNVIKIKNKNGESNYYKINEKGEISIDENLNKHIKETINTINKKLDIINNINSTEILQDINGKKISFEKSIAGERGISKHIDIENIKSFISGESNNINLIVNRGNGNKSTINLEYGKKLKVSLQNKYVEIGGIKYKIEIDMKDGKIQIILTQNTK